MAVGEAACVSVHGANRLGSNSLLDLVVFGREAARHCADVVKPGAAASRRSKAELRGGGRSQRLDALRNAKGSRRTADIRLDMQRIMQSDAAVFRTGETLNDGKRRLGEVFASFEDVQVTRPLAHLEHGSHRDPGARQPARPGGGDHALGGEPQGKPRRSGARGLSQSRRPELDEAHPVLGGCPRARRRFDYRPVHMNTLTDDVESIPPKARTY